MLTLFTMPKAFKGHIADIQHNAIGSWKHLSCVQDIVLLGSDPGVADAAKAHGVQHVPDIACNGHGTPLLNHMFAAAESHSQAQWFCYVNADIMLLSDFDQAMQKVLRQKKRVLVSGRRTDFDQQGRVVFEGDWQDRLRQKVHASGRLQGPPFLDFFVYNRGLWGDLPDAMPPFALGRFSWDNWLIYKARQLQVPVVDATDSICSVHQNHDYAHAGGLANAKGGSEAKTNLALAGGKNHLFTIWDATHALVDGKLKQRGPNTGQGLGGGIWSYRRSARL